MGAEGAMEAEGAAMVAEVVNCYCYRDDISSCEGKKRRPMRSTPDSTEVSLHLDLYSCTAKSDIKGENARWRQHLCTFHIAF